MALEMPFTSPAYASTSKVICLLFRYKRRYIMLHRGQDKLMELQKKASEVAGL